MSKQQLIDGVHRLASAIFADPTSLDGIGQEKQFLQKHTHCVTKGYPYLVYEVREVFNLTRCALVELESREKKRVAIPVIPSISPLYSELSAVAPSLYTDLSLESYHRLRQDPVQQRRYENMNRLAAQRREDKLYLFHFVGDQGHKLCASVAQLGKTSLDLVQDVRKLSIYELGDSAQYQILLSGENLESMIATRSSNKIHIFRFSWKEPYELHLLGAYYHKGARITDMRICPYVFPELIFCCMDGSLHCIDLEALMTKNEEQVTHLVAQTIVSSSDNQFRALCEYGYGPRHIFLAVGNEIKNINLVHAGSEEQISTVCSFKKNEVVVGMQSTMSNTGSKIKNKFLLAILTTGRLHVLDIRAFPELLFSWDFDQEITKANTLFFFLEPFRHNTTGEKSQLGRLIYGEFTSGDFHEVNFLTSAHVLALDMSIELQSEKRQRCILMKKRERVEDDGLFSIAMSQKRMKVDSEAMFAYGLEYFNDALHSQTVFIPSFVDRLREAYPSCFPETYRLLPSKEVTQWKEFFKKSSDTLGIVFIPPTIDALPGLVVRLSPVGDVVFHEVGSSDDPALVSLNKLLKRADDFVFKKLDNRWKVIWEESTQCTGDDIHWTGNKAVLDLVYYELNCGSRESVVRYPKRATLLNRLRMNMPNFLVSSKLGGFGKLTYTQNEPKIRFKCSPPLPLIFHTSFSYSAYLRKEEEVHEERIKVQMNDMNWLLRTQHSISLWTLQQELLRSYHQIPASQNEDNVRKKMGQDKKRQWLTRRFCLSNDDVSTKSSQILNRARGHLFDATLAYEINKKISDYQQQQNPSTEKRLRRERKLIPSLYSMVHSNHAQTTQTWTTYSSNGNFGGANIVFLPVEGDKSTEPEAKIIFKETSFKTIVPFPEISEDEKIKLHDVEASWKQEWDQDYKRHL